MSDIRKHDPEGGDYDFGDDDAMPPVTDPAFDAWVERMAPTLNAPPATPRMAMWDAIQAAQEATPASASAPVVNTASRRRTTWIWPAAIAAALVLGVGIDRYMLTSPPRTTQVASAPARTLPTTNGNDTALTSPSRLYRIAAVQTLTQAEALLTAYRSTDLATRNPAAAKQLGAWGREVLSSTRLLLDSPAGDDPQLRSLLDDIELVLVQVIRLSGSPPDSIERALIDGAMRDHELLPRIRTAVPAGIVGATD
ncbi:MAG: hypothetical protein M3Z05_04680 [Gemmatimonadota bacterium]|nr:hypothetical protein [Gemmatimonadota bacterium]